MAQTQQLTNGAVADVNALCYVDVEDMTFSSQEPLKAMQRQNCPKCSKRQGFFCFDCVIPLTPGVPKLQLPVKIEVVQHGESNAKATGTQAALLAPDHVTLRRHDDGSSHHRRTDPLALALPEYDPDRTVVLYPESKDTPCIGTPEAGTFDTAILLEGSWQKAKGLLMRHPKLQGLRKVQLPGEVRTVYWRRGAGSFKGVVDEGVCTIECIYYLCRALDPTPARYDDLLWYFTHIRSLVLKQAAPMTAHFLGQMEEARRARKAGSTAASSTAAGGTNAGSTTDGGTTASSTIAGSTTVGSTRSGVQAVLLPVAGEGHTGCTAATAAAVSDPLSPDLSMPQAAGALGGPEQGYGPDQEQVQQTGGANAGLQGDGSGPAVGEGLAAANQVVGAAGGVGKKRRAEERLEREHARLAQQRAFKEQQQQQQQQQQ